MAVPLLQLLRQLTPDDGSLSDADLLHQFAHQRDEAAFELLLGRHGGMVWGVCRRVAPDFAAAEDAYQATALALARHAGRIRGAQSLAGWLYRVAQRAALETRSRQREIPVAQLPDRPLPGPDPAATAEARELAQVIDAELSQLPEIFRVPFILCELEGRSNAEAATLLGCPVGTVESRLTRARGRLRTRLADRGVTLSLGVLAPGLVPAAVRAAALRVAIQPASASRTLLELAARALGTAGTAYLRALVLVLISLTALAVTLAAAFPGSAVLPPQRGEEKAQPAEEPVVPAVIAQLGSSRFRHPRAVFHAAYAPDGKTIATACLGSISIWESATGKLLRRVEQLNTPYHRVAFSATGKELYVIAGPTQGGCELLTFDPATGAERHRLPIGKMRYAGAEFSFSATRLAVFSMQEMEIVLIDPAAGKELIRVPASWRGNTLTPNGQRLLLADGNPVIRVLNAATGQEIERLSVGDRRPDWARFTPGGALLCAGQNWVERRDPKTNKSIWYVDFLPAGNGLEVSPDGRWTAHFSPYGVTVINVETGKKHFQVRDAHYTGVCFAPDSQSLALACASGVLTWRSTATGKPLPQSPELAGVISELTFSRDGQTLTAVAGEQWVSWDLAPAQPDPQPKPLGRFTVLAPGAEVGLRPDSFERADLPAEFVSARTGQRISRLDPPETGDTVIISRGDYRRGYFSGDARRFVGHQRSERGAGGEQTELGLAVWDVQTGKRLAQRPNVNAITTVAAVSPDGKAVAILPPRPGAAPGTGHQLALWEPDTGRTRWTRPVGTTVAPFIAFTRSGSWLVVQEVYRATPPSHLFQIPPPSGPHPFVILDPRTGREILRANGPDLGVELLVFADQGFQSVPNARAISPEGSMVAISDFTGTIYLWDLLTDGERGRITHPGPVHDLAFSPDGRTLAAASLAAPVVVHDLYAIRQRPERPPDAATLARAWTDLASPSAATAFWAVRTFSAAGEVGLRVLQERLNQVQRPSPEMIQGWIRDLGSEKFKIRERALTELTKLGRRVHPQLEAALQKPASLEVATRLRQLLERRTRFDAEDLRAARAQEVRGIVEGR